jgi:MFS family permease
LLQYKAARYKLSKERCLTRHWRVIADLALLAIFAGFFSVPMYALIQMRSQPSHRARIIAANNILNALFMMVSALLVSGLLALHWTIPEISSFWWLFSDEGFARLNGCR